jgi:chromosome segregation ATPase
MALNKLDSGNNHDMNIVELLRVKTEEADMDAYLKTSFGGYTKQSVLEYLSILRKNQQIMSETFYKNQQTLYEEKEKVRKNNESLQIKLDKLDTEYQNLCEAMMTFKLENKEFTVQDIIALKNHIAALEEELKRSRDTKANLEKKIDFMDQANHDLMIKLEQSNLETEAQKEMLIAEKMESKKLRDMVSDLSSRLETERDEIKYWKALQTEGQVAQLTAKVNELTEQLSVQTDLIAKQNTDRMMREQAMESLTAEVAVLKSTIRALTESLENINIQNDKLIQSNKTLTIQMEEEYKKTMNLIQEKSDITIDKLIALKKLSEAESKISMLEVQLNKGKKMEEINSIK